MPHNGIADHKAPLPKYTDYHTLNAPNKNVFRKLNEMRGNRSKIDVKMNYAYHKDIGNNTVKCNALRDEIKRLI